MNYLSLSYKYDLIVSIGTVSVVCEHWLALKFMDESKGMCCFQGKVKLEEINYFSPLNRFTLSLRLIIRNPNNSCAIYAVIITHFK